MGLAKTKVAARCKTSHIEHIKPILEAADMTVSDLVCAVVRVFYAYSLESGLSPDQNPMHLNRAVNDFFGSIGHSAIRGDS